MTKRKTLLSAIFLTLILFLNMIPDAKAAEGDRVDMTTNNTEPVTHRELVFVTISANRSFVYGGITIAYDAAELKPVEEECTVTEGFQISGAKKPLTVNGQPVVRISSFPGEGGHTVGGGEPLAVLAFRTLTPGEDIAVTMNAAFLYTESRESIDPKTAEPEVFDVKAIPVTGISLSQDALIMEVDDVAIVKATLTPSKPSDDSVTWTSSNEDKVTVVNGKIQAHALTESPVTITASAGGCTASCLVTVVESSESDYVVSMPPRTTATVEEIVTISPVIKIKEDSEINAYNTYSMTFTYDPQKLELTDMDAVEDTNATLTTSDGIANVVGYGADQKMETAPVTLTFRIRESGESKVLVTSARVDHAENAQIHNAPKASFDPDFTVIVGTGYPVYLPDAFTGAGVAEPNKEYFFEANDKGYDYTFENTTMAGEPVSVKDHKNGKYSIENVTGALNILAKPIPKTFKVTLGEYMEGPAAAQYMTDYTAELNDDDNYIYTLRSISIGGIGYGGYSYNNGKYTIPGKDIVGDIIFDVERTVPPTTIHHKVIFQGSGAGAATGNETTVPNGVTYSFALKTEAGFRYTVTCQMGEKEAVTLQPNEKGKYTVANVIGNLTITIEKEQLPPHDRVEVKEYLSLDETTMYLVLLYEAPNAGQNYRYDGNLMYYSYVYGAWCILTPETSLTVEAAEMKISVQSGETTAVGSVNGDVNMSQSVDINDAQLVHDLYNRKYKDFTIIIMRKFLNADVNADFKVDMTDAAAVAFAIK